MMVERIDKCREDTSSTEENGRRRSLQLIREEDKKEKLLDGVSNYDTASQASIDNEPLASGCNISCLNAQASSSPVAKQPQHDRYNQQLMLPIAMPTTQYKNNIEDNTDIYEYNFEKQVRNYDDSSCENYKRTSHKFRPYFRCRVKQFLMLATTLLHFLVFGAAGSNVIRIGWYFCACSVFV